MILMEIDFLRPDRLWWMLLVPAILFIYLVLAKRLSSGKKKSKKLQLILPKDKPWKRHLVVFTACLSLTSLVLAYAQPATEVKTPRDRATIVLVIDVSRSMMAQDVKPTRMDAAKDAAKNFVQDVPAGFNIAVIAFAGTANMIAPPTTDRGVVSRAIDSLEMAPSTAIGESIYKGLASLDLVPEDPNNPDELPPAAMILLSDGETNTGRSSARAAQDARDQNVPVYTIAYGTSTGYIQEGGIKQPVPVNHRELQEVAKISGGEKYSADSADSLKSVYEQIRQSVGYELTYAEITDRFAGIALFFAILVGFGAISLSARWP